MATNSVGDIEDPNPDLNGLLGAILGKQVNQNTQSGQATTSNTNTASTGQSATQGTQNTDTQSVQSSQSLSNASTSGTTQNTGTNRTTGTIERSTDTTQQGTSKQQTSADISGLQSVFDRQSQGITPEMLDAIFREGAKAAPQLVTANANALGARSSDNSPVAQVLKSLSVDLTSKAADLNRQLLSDAGATAGRIGELTKSIDTTNSNTSSSTGIDVQDLLTATDSKQISEQLQQTINNTQQTAATGSQTTNASTTNTAQNTVGTQNQVSEANEQKKTATTINTGAAKTLAGAFVGGVALDQIFRAMSGKGFTGTMVDLAKQLVGRGANLSAVNQQLVSAGFPIITEADAAAYVDASGENLDALWEDIITDSGVYDLPDVPDVPIPDIEIDYPYPDDIFAFADGGQPSFLPVPSLLKKKPELIAGDPDADLNALATGADSLFGALTGLGGASAGTSLGGGSGSVPEGGEPGPAVGGSSNNIGAGSPGAVSGISGIAAGLVSSVTGLHPALVGLVIGGIAKAVTPSISASGGGGPGPSAAPSSPTGSVSVSSGESITNDEGETVGVTGGGDGGSSDADGAAGIGGNSGGSPGDSGGGPDGDGGGSSADGDGGSADGSAYADGGRVRREPIVGTRSPLPSGEGGGGLSREAIRRAAGLTHQSPAASAPMRFEKGTIPRVEKGLREAEGYADGGEVDDDYHERLMQAMGISCEPDGGMKLDKNAVRMVHHAITSAPSYKHGGKVYKQGGEIKGPGTGTSDSVPAKVGQVPIKVSNGEFIIPADVVDHFGADAFQSLIDAIHTPVRK